MRHDDLQSETLKSSRLLSPWNGLDNVTSSVASKSQHSHGPNLIT